MNVTVVLFFAALVLGSAIVSFIFEITRKDRQGQKKKLASVAVMLLSAGLVVTSMHSIVNGSVESYRGYTYSNGTWYTHTNVYRVAGGTFELPIHTGIIMIHATEIHTYYSINYTNPQSNITYIQKFSQLPQSITILNTPFTYASNQLYPVPSREVTQDIGASILGLILLVFLGVMFYNLLVSPIIGKVHKKTV